MREIGVVMNLRELGMTEDMFDSLVRSAFVMEGGYKELTQEEILEIFTKSM